MSDEVAVQMSTRAAVIGKLDWAGGLAYEGGSLEWLWAAGLGFSPWGPLHGLLECASRGKPEEKL